MLASQMLVLNTTQAPQIRELALEVTYPVAPKWKHACKIYSNLNLMVRLTSLSQLNLNSTRKLSNFCYEARTTKEGEGGSLAEQFSYPFWELSSPKIANQVSSLGLHIYKLLQFFLVSYQVIILCMCNKYFFLKHARALKQTNDNNKVSPGGLISLGINDW